MTSTEFNIGFGDSTRASSKVLKPPGGGSSDIFGTQSSQSHQASRKADSTQSRLFGSGEPHPASLKPDRMKSYIFNDQPASSPKSAAKKFVSRNPITGEVIEIASTNGTEDDEETVSDTVADGVATNGTETTGPENGNPEDNDEKSNSEMPTKEKDPVTGDGPEGARPVQTCIRVRNPPGGKSSGIF